MSSDHDLAETVFDALRPRGRSWCLPRALHGELTASLSRAFADPRLPQDQVVHLLKLIAVFAEEATHRGVDRDLIEILRSIPAAVARISQFLGEAPEDPFARRWLRAFEDAEEPVFAPPDPNQAQLSDLFPPLDPMEMRARRASRMKQRESP